MKDTFIRTHVLSPISVNEALLIYCGTSAFNLTNFILVHVSPLYITLKSYFAKILTEGELIMQTFVNYLKYIQDLFVLYNVY